MSYRMHKDRQMHCIVPFSPNKGRIELFHYYVLKIALSYQESCVKIFTIVERFLG